MKTVMRVKSLIKCGVVSNMGKRDVVLDGVEYSVESKISIRIE